MAQITIPSENISLSMLQLLLIWISGAVDEMSAGWVLVVLLLNAYANVMFTRPAAMPYPCSPGSAVPAWRLWSTRVGTVPDRLRRFRWCARWTRTRPASRCPFSWSVSMMGRRFCVSPGRSSAETTVLRWSAMEWVHHFYARWWKLHRDIFLIECIAWHLVDGGRFSFWPSRPSLFGIFQLNHL